MAVLISESPFSPPLKEAPCDLEPRRAGKSSGLLSHLLNGTESCGTDYGLISVLWGMDRGLGGGGGAERGI